MPDLLLELRSEEIPARMQRRAAGDLKKKVTDALVDAGLVYEAAREYWTPRRLALDLRGLSARSAEIREERKGPRTDAPEKAIEGFLRGAGLTSVDQAEIRTDPKKGDFYVAVVRKPGRDAAEIIAAIMPAIIRDFPWPKSMRWGAQSAEPGALRWVRPLQSIVCTFGPETEEPEIILFTVDGISSGDVTYGHRFHAPEPIKVRRFDDYAASLERAKVIVDGERRKQIILTDARNLAFANGLELIEDDALLEEVAGLVEWPVVLLGEFEERFLTIPSEVIRLTIKTNQKCLVARRQGEEELSNRFVLVANIEAGDGGSRIASGNGLVVQARLSDAVHFWTTDRGDLPDMSKLEDSAARFDLDLKRPLDQRLARLDHLGVTFHGRLGTQGERVRRIVQLASFLAPLVGADPDLARRAATLAKADLTTEIVGEFPELQGVMGRKYAELQGEEKPVSKAIEEHYLPQGPSDMVPTEPVSIAVALSDKLDMLAGFWAIDEKPTGSKDPFALRRAALGIIRILLENGIRLQIIEAAKVASSNLAVIGQTGPGDTVDDAVQSLLAFFHERLKVWLRDSGARHDLIDAVITRESDDLLTIVRRVEALGAFLATEDGNNLLAGTKRANNILEAEAKKGAVVDGAVEPALFASDEEHSLFDGLEEVEKLSAKAIAAEDYQGAMGLMARLRQPIDAFFDAVLVNAEDPAIKTNRLALLARIRAATGKVADFSKIAG